MAFYDGVFDTLGLRDWCNEGKTEGPMTMAELLAAADGDAEVKRSAFDIPFPSLDNLHEACGSIGRSRDAIQAGEDAFLAAKDPLRSVLDPLTDPLSWFLDGALAVFSFMPWYLMVFALLALTYFVSRKWSLVVLVGLTLGFYLFLDYFDLAMMTLAIITVCTILCVLVGVPIGIAMSRSRRLRDLVIPILDMLQTLPTFVYLIPLIILFGVTESKIYGIAIILYAIVPVVRLTDLGLRLVDKEVIEAADAFGMSKRQKLYKVEIPLALPNIMAGVNQTIMMALAMVVIASLISAPGLGVHVLRGIRNLEIGVGMYSGLFIVLMAICLDRVSKAALNRINVTHS